MADAMARIPGMGQNTIITKSDGLPSWPGWLRGRYKVISSRIAATSNCVFMHAELCGHVLAGQLGGPQRDHLARV